MSRLPPPSDPPAPRQPPPPAPGTPGQQPTVAPQSPTPPSPFAGVATPQSVQEQFHAQLDPSVHETVKLAIRNLEQMAYDLQAGVKTLQQQLFGGAIATATIAAGAVSAITLTAGGYYIKVPLIKITGGGGSGATAVANMTGNLVSGVTITNGGTGYTSAPTVTFIT